MITSTTTSGFDPDPPAPEPPDSDGNRKMDSELKTIGSILRQLNELEQPAQSRVIAYLASRFPKV